MPHRWGITWVRGGGGAFQTPAHQKGLPGPRLLPTDRLGPSGGFGGQPEEGAAYMSQNAHHLPLIIWRCVSMERNCVPETFCGWETVA